MQPKALSVLFAVFSAVSIILLIIVSLSSPINKSLALLEANGLGSRLVVGAYGICFYVKDARRCTATSIGYNLGESQLGARCNQLKDVTDGLKIPGADDIQDSLDSFTSTGMLLHPIGLSPCVQ